MRGDKGDGGGWKEKNSIEDKYENYGGKKGEKKESGRGAGESNVKKKEGKMRGKRRVY